MTKVDFGGPFTLTGTLGAFIRIKSRIPNKVALFDIGIAGPIAGFVVARQLLSLREYTLALGQKRAESVVKALKLLGVNDNQVEAVSFGKERPAVQGSDEAAWAKNRRAELSTR